MPTRDTFGDNGELLRRLLEISGKEHESYVAVAQDYLPLACELLQVSEVELNSGGAGAWGWDHASLRIAACEPRDFGSAAVVRFKRRNGGSGALIFPGREALSAAEMQLTELVAFSAGRALDRYSENAERIRRGVLEREREQLLERFLSGASVSECLNAAVALVDRHAPNCRAALLAVDGWAVECVAAPGLPKEYRRATSALRGLPSAEHDSAETSAAMHERVRHIEIAAQLGYPWCESAPLLSRSGEMLGLFMAHSADPPAAATREILRNVGRLAAMMMEQRKLQIHAAWLTEHDPLTGLANVDALRRALVTAVAAGQPVGVLCISLDRFRNLNGALGRTAGDLLIKRVADRIRTSIEAGDIAARSSGDEFSLAVMGRPSERAVLSFAEVVRKAIARPFHIEGNELTLTCSIGASIWPDGGRDADALLRHAEIAMLRARDHGPGHIQSYASPLKAGVEPSRFLVERALSQAVGRNEMELHFQPMVGAHGGLCGFEALLSWKHPEYGLIPAADFIPIAEEADLIIPIGEWVLRRLCAQAVQWQGPGSKQLRFWVNVSARQFCAPGFAQIVRSAISDSGVDASCLVLELTETAIMREVEQSAGLMSELRQAGVRLAIDDFGTGYSSLNYLRMFPVQAIKMDQSFVRDLSDSMRALAIMQSMVALGHTLGLEVVAEGVETQAQFELLRQAGCDLAQGYLFGSPMPAPAAEALIREHRPEAPAGL
ncbi:MAG TPA: bifunctional diguanylate cyclase/phosphodiesterase [Bryobacteraceae bacterium]|nr:bifunctional diguanylate cyclase/phosphodiesterase [Bryobacteraceae bacterium]